MASTRTTPSKEAAAAIAAAGVAAVGGKLAWDKRSSKRETDPRAYRLQAGESVPDGMRRIARGRLDNAVEDLAKAVAGEDVGGSVHETRKGLKRLRTCLRLARSAIGEDTYRQENATFRDAGRRLGGARDAQVLIETLDSVEERFAAELPSETATLLRSELARKHDQAERSLSEGDAIPVARDELTRARARTAGWTFGADGFDALAPGLRRVYRRGGRAMRAAARESHDENFHEWRKRVKDLWYASQIVTPAAPKRLRRFARRAHRLSDLLGDDHDLALLAEYVDGHPHHVSDEASRQAIHGAIERRRHELQQQALKLGAKIYDERPKKFVRSISRPWRKRRPDKASPLAG